MAAWRYTSLPSVVAYTYNFLPSVVHKLREHTPPAQGLISGRSDREDYNPRLGGHSLVEGNYPLQNYRPHIPEPFFSFLMCMFYQLLCVQHSCSSTQSWGSVLPSIVETRNQNSWGCPLLFSNRNLGSFCA